MLSALNARGMQKQFAKLSGVHWGGVNYVADSATVVFDETASTMRIFLDSRPEKARHVGMGLTPGHGCGRRRELGGGIPISLSPVEENSCSSTF